MTFTSSGGPVLLVVSNECGCGCRCGTGVEEAAIVASAVIAVGQDVG